MGIETQYFNLYIPADSVQEILHLSGESAVPERTIRPSIAVSRRRTKLYQSGGL